MARNKNKEISAALLKKVAPLLPVVEASAKGGRPRVSDELALNGILFVLRTGIPWEELPQELGFGSGMTCWRRLRDWQAAGVWHRLHLLLLDVLAAQRRAGEDDLVVPHLAQKTEVARIEGLEALAREMPSACAISTFGMPLTAISLSVTMAAAASRFGLRPLLDHRAKRG
ncbi:hypothetical protein VCH24_64970 [Variovorax boronicumulans]|jgi:transposase|nr:hypothetical protein VCH24_64970 [Variovorax boronicumulans]